MSDKPSASERKASIIIEESVVAAMARKRSAAREAMQAKYSVRRQANLSSSDANEETI